MPNWVSIGRLPRRVQEFLQKMGAEQINMPSDWVPGDAAWTTFFKHKAFEFSLAWHVIDASEMYFELGFWIGSEGQQIAPLDSLDSVKLLIDKITEVQTFKELNMREIFELQAKLLVNPSGRENENLSAHVKGDAA